MTPVSVLSLVLLLLEQTFHPQFHEYKVVVIPPLCIHGAEDGKFVNHLFFYVLAKDLLQFVYSSWEFSFNHQNSLMSWPYFLLEELNLKLTELTVSDSETSIKQFLKLLLFFNIVVYLISFFYYMTFAWALGITLLASQFNRKDSSRLSTHLQRLTSNSLGTNWYVFSCPGCLDLGTIHLK